MEHINNTEMAIDFLDLEEKSLEELRNLIDKYKKIVFNYKKDIFPQAETIAVFGDKPFIYDPQFPTLINLKLIKKYRKILLNNYSNLIDLTNKKKKEISIEKKIQSKEKHKIANHKYYEENRDKLISQGKEKYKQQKEIITERIVCKICNGTYTFTNKNHHLNTLKHKKSIPEIL